MAQARQFPVKRPAGFHWDFFLLGITTLVSGFLGLPAPNGLVPQCPWSTEALSVYEQVEMPKDDQEEKSLKKRKEEFQYSRHHIVNSRVVENRLGHLLVGLLTLGTMTRPLLVVLGTMPRAIFAGIFVLVGWSSIESNPITTRTLAIFKDRHLGNIHDELGGLQRRKIALFVGIQWVFFAMTIAISQTIAAIGFPVIFTLLIPFRYYIVPKWFTPAELRVLDAPTADADVVLASIGQETEAVTGQGQRIARDTGIAGTEWRNESSDDEDESDRQHSGMHSGYGKQRESHLESDAPGYTIGGDDEEEDEDREQVEVEAVRPTDVIAHMTDHGGGDTSKDTAPGHTDKEMGGVTALAALAVGTVTGKSHHDDVDKSAAPAAATESTASATTAAPQATNTATTPAQASAAPSLPTKNNKRNKSATQSWWGLGGSKAVERAPSPHTPVTPQESSAPEAEVVPMEAARVGEEPSGLKRFFASKKPADTSGLVSEEGAPVTESPAPEPVSAPTVDIQQVALDQHFASHYNATRVDTAEVLPNDLIAVPAPGVTPGAAPALGRDPFHVESSTTDTGKEGAIAGEAGVAGTAAVGTASEDKNKSLLEKASDKIESVLNGNDDKNATAQSKSAAGETLRTVEPVKEDEIVPAAVIPARGTSKETPVVQESASKGKGKEEAEVAGSAAAVATATSEAAAKQTSIEEYKQKEKEARDAHAAAQKQKEADKQKAKEDKKRAKEEKEAAKKREKEDKKRRKEEAALLKKQEKEKAEKAKQAAKEEKAAKRKAEEKAVVDKKHAEDEAAANKKLAEEKALSDKARREQQEKEEQKKQAAEGHTDKELGGVTALAALAVGAVLGKNHHDEDEKGEGGDLSAEEGKTGGAKEVSEPSSAALLQTESAAAKPLEDASVVEPREDAAVATSSSIETPPRSGDVVAAAAIPVDTQSQAKRDTEEEDARKAAEDETARKIAVEEATRKAAEEETARKVAEEEAARKAAEEETARMVAEEQATRKAAEEETARKLAQEEAARKAAEEETARKAAEANAARVAAEEEQARKTAEEEAAKTKAAEEEAARKTAQEEQARKAAEEEAAKKKAAEEAALVALANDKAALEKDLAEVQAKKDKELRDLEESKKAKEKEISDAKEKEEAALAVLVANQKTTKEDIDSRKEQEEKKLAERKEREDKEAALRKEQQEKEERSAAAKREQEEADLAKAKKEKLALEAEIAALEAKAQSARSYLAPAKVPKSSLTALSGQVAGHEDSIYSLGDDSLIVKHCTPAESTFYQSILIHQTAVTKKSQLELLARLRKYLPTYHGTIQLTSEGSTEADTGDLAVVLENLTRGYKHANVLDIKLGKQLWDDDASEEKKQRMMEAAKSSTSGETGVRLTAWQVWNNAKGEFIKVDKKFGKTVKSNELYLGLRCFFGVSSEMEAAKITHLAGKEVPASAPLSEKSIERILHDGVLPAIKEIIDIVKKLEWRVRGSSLLIVYEGDEAELKKINAKSALVAGRALTDTDQIVDTKDLSSAKVATTSRLVDVRLIDFAHASFGGEKGADEGYLAGLETAKHQIEDLYKGLHKGNLHAHESGQSDKATGGGALLGSLTGLFSRDKSEAAAKTASATKSESQVAAPSKDKETSKPVVAAPYAKDTKPVAAKPTEAVTGNTDKASMVEVGGAGVALGIAAGALVKKTSKSKKSKGEAEKAERAKKATVQPEQSLLASKTDSKAKQGGLMSLFSAKLVADDAGKKTASKEVTPKQVSTPKKEARKSKEVERKTTAAKQTSFEIIRTPQPKVEASKDKGPADGSALDAQIPPAVLAKVAAVDKGKGKEREKDAVDPKLESFWKVKETATPPTEDLDTASPAKSTGPRKLIRHENPRRGPGKAVPAVQFRAPLE